jgi:integrase
MARKPTGQVVEDNRGAATVYALRFRAYGKRRYLTLGSANDGWTRARADDELQNVLADVRRGIWRAPEPVTELPQPRVEPTFHEFASEWFATHAPEWAENTRLDYQWQLSNHLLPYFAGFRLSQITIEEVDRFRHWKVAEKALGPTSINKTITRLAQVLELAVEYGWLERNPARGSRRRVRAAKPKRTWLDTAEKISAMLGAAGELDAQARAGDPRHRRALLATLTFAGLRIGELLALRWADVDLAAGRLRVADSKTSAGLRTVDLVPVLRDELASLRARNAGAGGDALVFPTATGAKQNRNNVRRRVVQRAVTLANQNLEADGHALIPDGITAHSLRRTYASVRLAIGDEVPYVMQQLGHTDPKLTLSVYAHVMFREPGERARLRDIGGEGSPMGPDVRSSDKVLT